MKLSIITVKRKVKKYSKYIYDFSPIFTRSLCKLLIGENCNIIPYLLKGFNQEDNFVLMPEENILTLIRYLIRVSGGGSQGVGQSGLVLSSHSSEKERLLGKQSLSIQNGTQIYIDDNIKIFSYICKEY